MQLYGISTMKKKNNDDGSNVLSLPIKSTTDDKTKWEKSTKIVELVFFDEFSIDPTQHFFERQRSSLPLLELLIPNEEERNRFLLARMETLIQVMAEICPKGWLNELYLHYTRSGELLKDINEQISREVYLRCPFPGPEEY